MIDASEKRNSERDKKGRVSSFGQRARNICADTVVHILLAVGGIVWLLPIFYLIYTAFRVTPSTGIINTLFPDNLELGFGNFAKLFKETDFGIWFWNTLKVATCSCVLTTLFTLATAYALSRMRFKMRKPLMNVMLVLGMFPGFMSMIAVYFILKAMGLTNSHLALILVYSGGAAMGYYIAKGFFDTIPHSLEEAAVLDGASQWTIFWRIILPLSKPIVVYTILTSFIGPWGDFIFVNVIINNTTPEKFTLALGLYRLINSDNGAFNLHFTEFCAGASIVGLLIGGLFIFMQKYYVEGVTSGAVKD